MSTRRNPSRSRSRESLSSDVNMSRGQGDSARRDGVSSVNIDQSQRPQLSVSNDVLQRIVSGAVSSALSELQQSHRDRRHEGETSAQPQPQARSCRHDRPNDDEDAFQTTKRRCEPV